MTDLECAKALLSQTDHTIVLCRSGACYTDNRRGIAPMLGFVERGIDLRGFSVADRVVGKAAAMLFVCAGIKQVYAAVVSRPALDTLAQYHIPCEWGTLVPFIINRAGDGPCPMETAVRELDDAAKAPRILREALQKL